MVQIKTPTDFKQKCNQNSRSIKDESDSFCSMISAYIKV